MSETNTQNILDKLIAAGYHPSFFEALLGMEAGEGWEIDRTLYKLYYDPKTGPELCLWDKEKNKWVGCAIDIECLKGIWTRHGHR
jgi:hypothetical protein